MQVSDGLSLPECHSGRQIEAIAVDRTVHCNKTPIRISRRIATVERLLNKRLKVAPRGLAGTWKRGSLQCRKGPNLTVSVLSRSLATWEIGNFQASGMPQIVFNVVQAREVVWEGWLLYT